MNIPFLFSWQDVSRVDYREFNYPVCLIALGWRKPDGVRYLRVLLPIWRRVYDVELIEWTREPIRVMWTSIDGWFMRPRQLPMSPKDIARSRAEAA